MVLLAEALRLELDEGRARAAAARAPAAVRPAQGAVDHRHAGAGIAQHGLSGQKVAHR